MKIITSFGDLQGGGGRAAKFFSQADGGQTPIAAGVTPIAESAVDADPTTAVVRGNRSAFNTPTSVKSFASSAYSSRAPLPAIGEANGELSAGGANRDDTEEEESISFGLSIARAHTASPMMMRDGLRNARDNMPPPDASVTRKMEQHMTNRRNGSRNRMPTGLNLHIEPVDHARPTPDTAVAQSAKYHWPRRRGPGSVSSVTSASTSRSTRTGASRHADYIHSLDAATDFRKSGRGRESSRERQTQREPSLERGRTPIKVYPGKRSPTSPIPMSPEDLVVLSSAKYTDVTATDPIGHRKVSNKSRSSNKGASRRASPERRPSLQDSRGRTPGLEGIRSPTSPQPMTGVPPQLDDTEDEEDYFKAIESQQKFREKHNRSTSRGLVTPTTAPLRQDRSRSRTRKDSTSNLNGPAPYLRGGSVEHAGDLKAMKEERQRRREQAARELEERRRELSRNSQAGPITHPKDLAPALRYTAVEMSSSSNAISPPRAKTADPHLSPYGRGKLGTPQIGLPATPKAMRLVIDTSSQSQVSAPPAVPPIPSSFVQVKAEEDQAPAEIKRQESPNKEPEVGGLTLLPSTVYQPPSRPPIPRCMSAPIPDEPLGGKPSHRTSSRSGTLSRNQSIRSKGRDSHGAGETLDSRTYSRRGSQDTQHPPPPPPPPSAPLLKEFQHLAMPPPPPPAPLPFALQQQSSNSALASGMIEIVMDDDEPPSPSAPIHVPPTELTVPILPPPAPPSLKGHSRGRSITDSSLAGRISKATERLRSGSRTRKDNSMRVQKSPEVAPYESIQAPGLYTQMGMMAHPLDPNSLPTGLNKNEMI